MNGMSTHTQNAKHKTQNTRVRVGQRQKKAPSNRDGMHRHVRERAEQETCRMTRYQIGEEVQDEGAVRYLFLPSLIPPSRALALALPAKRAGP